MTTTPENPAPAETPSNNKLFYGSLMRALLRPEVRFTDARYLDVQVPPTENFPGATGRISDYLIFMLKRSDDIIEKRRAEFVAALERGEKGMNFPALTQEDHVALLQEGGAYIDVELVKLDSAERLGCLVVRPQDVGKNDFALAGAIEAGLKPIPDEPFVYSSGQKTYIPDPFAEPHWLALYNHLEGLPPAPAPATTPAPAA